MHALQIASLFVPERASILALNCIRLACFDMGCPDGSVVGPSLGCPDGAVVGASLGCPEGCPDGNGDTVGASLGCPDGTVVGGRVGHGVKSVLSIAGHAFDTARSPLQIQLQRSTHPVSMLSAQVW